MFAKDGKSEFRNATRQRRVCQHEMLADDTFKRKMDMFRPADIPLLLLLLSLLILTVHIAHRFPSLPTASGLFQVQGSRKFPIYYWEPSNSRLKSR